MQLGFDLSQKQTVKLALTAELQQSINILKYSSSELIDFIYEQSNDNPCLEITEKNIELLNPSNISQLKERANIQELKHDYQRQNYSSDFDYYNPIQNLSSTTETLEKHLLEQMAMVKGLSKLQKEILQFLIGNLNEHGYLEIEIKLVAHIFSSPLEVVEETISILQSFEPTGIGARNLKECLLLQIKLATPTNELAYSIIENHLHDLAEKRYRTLANHYSVSPQEIQHAADFITTLNPRPASSYCTETTNYTIPDVIVKKEAEGYIIMINDSFIPELSINSYYKEILKDAKTHSTGAYLKDKFNEAALLLKGIDQRNSTLYKVTEAILEEQPDFFKLGLKGIKPMVLRDISDKLSLHESTISRATSNKFIQTPHGLFKMKDFFTRGITQTAGQDSTLLIKERIKQIIQQENANKPYSDQKISDLLNTEGMKISRRTVAKYREELGILSSSKRVRF